MTAVVTPTALPNAWLRRLAELGRSGVRVLAHQVLLHPFRRLKVWHLNYLIKHAEKDLKAHQQELDNLPKQLDIDRLAINQLRIRLIDAEKNA